MAELRSSVHTFSIDFSNKQFSEGRWARRVAEICGTNHTEFTAEPELLTLAPAIAAAAGEPFADSSAVPTYVLSQLTRRQVTVALSGDGGDEAFAGYERHLFATRLDALGRLVRPVRPLVRGMGYNPASPSRMGRGLALAGLDPGVRYATLMTQFTPDMLHGLCMPAWLEDAGGPYVGWQSLTAASLGGVDRYLDLDTRTYLPGDLLLKVDRMSMAHGLEVRSPFLDQHVQEFAARLPQHHKLHRHTTKWLIKQLLTRRGFPAEIVKRRKQGFAIPISSWFRSELRPWLREVLLDPRTMERGYFRHAEIERLIKGHVDGTADHGQRLWNLVMLELWHRALIDA
jgi:asparagine synthase (glutamine-hydrolysing)